MCSRQVFASSAEIAEQLGLETEYEMEALDNGAPTDLSPVITLQEPKKLQYFKWGFPWRNYEDKSILTTCIRSDTVVQKFSRLLDAKRRCLSISKGFIEFDNKQPFLISAIDQPYTIIAGLWDNSPELTGDGYANRYAILTTEPNKLVSQYHHRMPIILTPQGQAKWLDPDASLEDLLALLVQYDANNMAVKLIDDEINNSRNKTAKIKAKDPNQKPPPPSQLSFF